MPDPREPDISREDDPLTIMFGADRAEIDALTALLAEAIELIRHPNEHDIASFLKRVTP